MTFNKIKIVTSSLLITSVILHTSISYADDSEIFFGSEQFSNVAKPNILFLLDYSISMKGERLENLRDAVAETLLNTSLQGVRVGVMRYPYAGNKNDAASGNAAKLIYPVTDIDSLDEGNLPETAARSTSGKDDAHQTKINGITKNVSVDSNVMLMGNLSASGTFVKTISLNGQRDKIFTLVRSGNDDEDNKYSNAMAYTCSLVLEETPEFCSNTHLTSTGSKGANHILSYETIYGEQRQVITGLNATTEEGDAGNALFIFKNVDIPASANITNATLTLTAERNMFRRTDHKDMCTGTSRGYRAKMKWRVATTRNFPFPTTDSLIYSKDGKTSAFNFYVTAGGTNETKNYMFEQTSSNYPGCYFPSGRQFPLNITQALKDALAQGSSTGNLGNGAARSGAPVNDIAIRFMIDWYDESYSRPIITTGQNAPKLDINYTVSQPNSFSNAGLRFNNVYIPQGANITNAKIKLVPAGGNDQPVDLKITAEKSADAKEFNATLGDFNTRARTTANRIWSITSPWETNAGDDPATKYVETPDISSILDEVVKSQDWCGGQSVAFFLDHQTGNGYRSAFTYDEGQSFRPVLEFTYEGGTNGCMTKTWEETLAGRSADGYQTGSTSNVPSISGNTLYASDKYRVGGYFTNVLLRNPKDPAANTVTLSDKGLVSAELILVPDNNVDQTTIKIYFDNAVNAERLKAAKNDLGARQLFPISTTCTIPKDSSGQKISCDITDMLRAKIQQEVSVSGGGKVAWQSGNNLVVIIQRDNRNIRFKPYETGYSNAMRIKIIAKEQLMAPNSLTIRRKIVNAVNAEEPTGGTPTMPAMLDAARYISNFPSSNAPSGPYQGTFYWNGQPQPSPLLSSCQMTHLVLMSDGSANYNGSNWRRALVSYTGKPWRTSTTNCEYNGAQDDSGSEACGQALVNFMSTKSQGINTDGRENWVTTHAVAFGSKSAGRFLERLVNANNPANKGRYFYAETGNDLVNAFMDIMDTAKGTFYNYTSGQVAVSNESRYNQRREIYYSLMEPSNRNHWSGNMKRFGLVYVTRDDESVQAVLVDAKGEDAVVKTEDGYWFISPLTTSWWNNVADGGDVHLGGVLDQLADNPASRKMYVMKGNTRFDFTANNVASSGLSKITPEDMDTPVDEDEDILKLTKGYVNYLRGYTFNAEGTTSENTIISKKKLRLGDFAHSAVTFATYGKCSALGQENASIIDCDATGNSNDYVFLDGGLQQIAFLAGNDGFFRAFDVRDGSQLYAVIPSEMLSLLPELQKRETIGSEVPRLYGLDGTISIFHDDVNNDGYVDNSEKAIAYVSAGRGGRVMYAINISNISSPSLLWKIEGNNSGEFNDLGYTWSTPVTGKIRWNGGVQNVVIFGGGYDPQQDQVEERTADSMGNQLYILNAETGQVIWKANQAKYSNMKYSIPSPVATLAREVDGNGNKLITDIFVGDMGGQLWRFHIGENGVVAVGDNGVVARVGGVNNKATAQRIYMAPAVYEFIDKENEGLISVNIGTGYLGHPLVTYNKDKFYSLRFEAMPNVANNKVLTEANLAEVTPSTIQGSSIAQDPNFQQNGFYVNFGAPDPKGISGNGAGEKMISPLVVARNATEGESAGVYFSTYVPNPNNMRTCKLASGWQRSYGFDVLTGESYFDGLFRTSTIIGIPPGVAIYCESGWCTPVWNYEDLARGNDEAKPFRHTPVDGSYQKTGWTNLFDPPIF